MYDSKGFRPTRWQQRWEGGNDAPLVSATLDGRSGNFQAADPTAGDIALTLPPEEESNGLMFWIANVGAGGNAVTVTDDSPALLATIQNGGGALVACDGTTWSLIIDSRALPGINVQILSGGLIILPNDPEYHQLDPGGSNRAVTLSGAPLNNRRTYHFSNFADGAETLTIAGIVTIGQNEAVRIVSDGTDWQHMGIVTIQLS